MLLKIPPLFRKRPGHGRKTLAPPVALTLVAASFDPDGPEIYLTFDRAVDISGVDIGAFAVVDGPDGHLLAGAGTPSLVSDVEVYVQMAIVGAGSGADVLLTAGAANGISAADDGGIWAGVSGMVLPWP